jgi:hypothetical protein
MERLRGLGMGKVSVMLLLRERRVYSHREIESDQL